MTSNPLADMQSDCAAATSSPPPSIDEVDEVSVETVPVKVDRHLKPKEMVRYQDLSAVAATQNAQQTEDNEDELMTFSVDDGAEADVVEYPHNKPNSLGASPPYRAISEKSRDNSSFESVQSVELANNDTNSEMEFGDDDEDEELVAAEIKDENDHSRETGTPRPFNPRDEKRNFRTVNSTRNQLTKAPISFMDHE